MKTKHFFKVMIGIVLSFMFVLCVNAQEDKDESSIIKIGDIAPDFTVQMLDGRSLKLSEMKGKVVLINFWATWCGPCMIEFKEIPEKILKRFEKKADFAFIPVSRGETKEIVKAKMNQLKSDGIDFPVGLDPDKVIYSKYATLYIPRNYLIDRDGKVVYTSIGYSEQEFERLINKLDELLK